MSTGSSTAFGVSLSSASGTPPGDASALEVRQRRTACGYLIEAAGELDLATAATLEHPLAVGIYDTTGAPSGARLSLDLRRLTYIDSAGLALLLELRRRLGAAERSLRVILRPNGQPDRVLRQSRFERIMTLDYSDL